MKAKKAGSGAALLVLLGVMGLVMLIAVILLMIFEGTGIEHRPGGKRVSSRAVVAVMASSRVLPAQRVS